jgi:hypothetical protein
MPKPADGVGFAVGEGLCPCPDPDGLPPMSALQRLAGATGAAEGRPGLPAGRTGPVRLAYLVTGPDVLLTRYRQTNTPRTDRSHGFGEDASYAVHGAAGATAHPVAANAHGKEIAVQAMSETVPLAAWCDRRRPDGRGPFRDDPARPPLWPRAKFRHLGGVGTRYPADGGVRPSKGRRLRG